MKLMPDFSHSETLTSKQYLALRDFIKEANKISEEFKITGANSFNLKFEEV